MSLLRRVMFRKYKKKVDNLAISINLKTRVKSGEVDPALER